ncbi:glycosyl transferase family 2 [Methylorubrum populi]|nr:glycosyl transferase family 2 [Methylorubrum populi]
MLLLGPAPASPPLCSFVVVTYRRDEALRRTLADLRSQLVGRSAELILVDNNADGVDRVGMLEGFERSTLLRQAENLGVAEGRNVGIWRSRGRFLVFLDDDASFAVPDAMDAVEAAFGEDPAIGAVAFRSFDAATGVGDPAEFPHTDKRLPEDGPIDTFRFIGVGHALRRDAVEQVGTYRPEFFYSMEEFDLSYRLLSHGWRIVYRPAVVVAHRRDPAGRVPSPRKVEMSVLNKLRIAFMHLPPRHAMLCATAWLCHGFAMRRGVYRVDRVLAEFVAWAFRNHELRRPLQPRVMRRIHEMGGVAWR